MLSRHIMERRRRDIVGLSLPDQTIVFEEIFLLTLVKVRLRLQNALGLGAALYVNYSFLNGCFLEISLTVRYSRTSSQSQELCLLL